MRLVAAPRIEASGVRKSWLIEASSVLRMRSASAAAFASPISRASRARSRAAAVSPATVSTMVRSSRSSGRVPPPAATPTAPMLRVPAFSGRKYQGTFGSVPVSAPAGYPAAARRSAAAAFETGSEAPTPLRWRARVPRERSIAYRLMEPE